MQQPLISSSTISYPYLSVSDMNQAKGIPYTSSSLSIMMKHPTENNILFEMDKKISISGYTLAKIIFQASEHIMNMMHPTIFTNIPLDPSSKLICIKSNAIIFIPNSQKEKQLVEALDTIPQLLSQKWKIYQEQERGRFLYARYVKHFYIALERIQILPILSLQDICIHLARLQVVHEGTESTLSNETKSMEFSTRTDTNILDDKSLTSLWTILEIKHANIKPDTSLPPAPIFICIHDIDVYTSTTQFPSSTSSISFTSSPIIQPPSLDSILHCVAVLQDTIHRSTELWNNLISEVLGKPYTIMTNNFITLHEPSTHISISYNKDNAMIVNANTNIAHLLFRCGATITTFE